MASCKGDATAGCVALVRLAAERWREHEKHYRDDITAIVAHLPFLEEDTEEMMPDGEAVGGVGSACADLITAPYPVNATATTTPGAATAGEVASRASRPSLSRRNSNTPDSVRTINSGERGIARMPSFEPSPAAQAADAAPTDKEEEEDEEEDDADGDAGFMLRRLSVASVDDYGGESSPLGPGSAAL